MHKTFGQYIKGVREQRRLDQKDVYGPTQGSSYLSEIETGKKNPSTRKTIAKIAGLLGLPQDERFIDWMWLYSLLDKDPYEYFRVENNKIAEQSAEYKTANGNHKEFIIDVNATESEVMNILGPPDKMIRVPSRVKWIYQTEGLHIVFANGRVVDVMFK